MGTDHESVNPSVGINPHVVGKVDDIEAACRRHHVVNCALVGSATQPESDVVPADLDLLIAFDSGDRGDYFELRAELEAIVGLKVDLIEESALRNTLLIAEFEKTKVVLYEDSR